jgi:hypothetical protein
MALFSLSHRRASPRQDQRALPQEHRAVGPQEHEGSSLLKFWQKKGPEQKPPAALPRHVQPPSALRNADALEGSNSPAAVRRPRCVAMEMEAVAAQGGAVSGANSYVPRTRPPPTPQQVAEAQSHMGWKGAPSPMVQPHSVDSGPTVIGMVAGSMGKSPQAAMAKAVQGRDLSQGTTPELMGQMLLGSGFRVSQGADDLSAESLYDSLRRGEMVIAQVDASLLRSGSKDGLPQSSSGAHYEDGPQRDYHYVLIDQVDPKGRLRVTDPADGSVHHMSPQQLREAAPGLEGSVFNVVPVPSTRSLPNR